MRDEVELQRVMLLNQDPPEHTATRHIISRGFTPRSIGALEEIMTERAHRIVEEAVERGAGNFVEEVAAELPLQAIADLLGVPQEDRTQAVRLVQPDARQRGPGLPGRPRRGRGRDPRLRHGRWPAERRETRSDDIVTKLINADKDGRGLNDDEFGYFVIMLAVAGNETTRNAITHGMNAFLDQPRPVAAVGRGASRDDGRRGDPLGDPDQRLPAHRLNDDDGRRRPGEEGPAGRAVLRQRQLRRGRLRGPYTFDITRATRTRTWPSVATARTTASAPTWPARRSG